MSSLPEAELRAVLEKAGMPQSALSSVIHRMPFKDDDALIAAVENAIVRIDDADVAPALEAIGEAQTPDGDPDTRDAASLALQLYRERFGYPFVSAIPTPTVEELLMRVRIRLGNEPGPEGRAARDHLRRIVRARLGR